MLYDQLNYCVKENLTILSGLQRAIRAFPAVSNMICFFAYHTQKDCLNPRIPHIIWLLLKRTLLSKDNRIKWDPQLESSWEYSVSLRPTKRKYSPVIGPPRRSRGHSRVSVGTPLSLLDMGVTSAGAAGYGLAPRRRGIWCLSAAVKGFSYLFIYYLFSCYFLVPYLAFVCANDNFVWISLSFYFLLIIRIDPLWFRIKTFLLIYRT